MNDSKKKCPRWWSIWSRSGSVLPMTPPKPSDKALASGTDFFAWSTHIGRTGQLVILQHYWDDFVSYSGVDQGLVRIAILARVLQEGLDKQRLSKEYEGVFIPVANLQRKEVISGLKTTEESGQFHLPHKAAKAVHGWLMNTQ